MEKRTLTEAERKRLEALIRAAQEAIDFGEKDLERAKCRLKEYQTFLRDFDQPALWPEPADNPDLQAVIDDCHRMDLERLEKLLTIKYVSAFGVGHPITVEE